MNKPTQARKRPNISSMAKKCSSMAEFPVVLLLLCCLPLSKTYAEDVVRIGSGAGHWLAGSLNQSVSITNTDAAPSTTNGVASITDTSGACMASSNTQTIDGVSAYRVAQGIWLVPNVTVTGYVTRNEIDIVTFNGTIGSPATTGSAYIDSTNFNMSIPSGKDWCLAFPSAIYPLRTGAAQSITIRGDWIIITDGSQGSGQYPLPEMWLTTFTASGHNSVSILPSTRVVRVSALECSVATQDAIDFGRVPRNMDPHAELATRSFSLSVSCGQPVLSTGGSVSTNINVRFLQGTGLYDTNPAWLATNPTGAYITGEIDNGVTGSGACGLNTGIHFDNTDINLGSIGAMETNKNFDQLITWRLCSGGAGLPSGAIQASAQLVVTYN